MTPTPTKRNISRNITLLAERAGCSRRQVRRDLAAGAPADTRGYVAWRRSREPDPRAELKYALARGVDAWRAFDRERALYVDRAGIADLGLAVMVHVRKQLAGFEAHAELVSGLDRGVAYAILADDLRDRLYLAGQLAVLALMVRTPDAPERLRRPAEAGLRAARAWVREAQTARVRLRGEIREGAAREQALVDAMRSKAGEARQTLLGACRRMVAVNPCTPEKMREHIKACLDDGLRGAEKLLSDAERRTTR
jgi:hypothetical protein